MKKLLLTVSLLLGVVLVGCNNEEPAATPPAVLPAGPVESTILVEAVTGMRDDFIRGIDIGSVITQENSGVTWYNWDGEEQDIFEIFAEVGVNLVRIRIWNNPFDEYGRGFGGGNNDVATAIEIGRRATAAGMGVQLNFHYSDFWADPGKQQAPRAWEGLPPLELAEALREFTYDSVRAIVDAGVDVWQVQIGNETNVGMAGIEGWNRKLLLFRAGTEAVRAVCPEIQIVIHFTNPERHGHFIAAARQLYNAGIDYDVFGASYYPFWHGTLENLTNVLTEVAETFDVYVMVVETSYPFTVEDGDGHPNVAPNFSNQTINYPVSVQGQATAIRNVFQAVADVGERAIGVIYWEPAWTPVGPPNEIENNWRLWETYGSGWASSFAASYDPYDAGLWYGGSAWDNQALFDFNGRPLASLNIFNYIRTGTFLAEGIVLEEMVAPELPQPELSEVEVIELQGDNLLVNASFDDPDMSMWNIGLNLPNSGHVERGTSDVRTGAGGLVFWQADDSDFYVEQEIVIETTGLYYYSIFIQGGQDGVAFHMLYIYILVNGELRYTVTTELLGWLEWSNPRITNIALEAGDVVTVGISVQSGPGVWGTFDDFNFYLVESLE